MLPSPVRRALLPVLVGVLAGLLPLLPAAPAHASATCQSEAPNALGLTCDDQTPPDTVSAAGSQTGSGQVTVTASSSYGTTGDTGPVAFECQLGGTAPWGPCVLSGLAAGAHDVAVRAVDTADRARTVPCDTFLCSGPETPDYDATPATVRVTVTGGGGTGGGGGTVPPPPGPGGAPETQISGGPSDKITPDQPVALTKRLSFVLTASEAVTYNCAVNAQKVPCHEGVNVLRRLRPGTAVLVAQAVDAEGNFDATPASLTFYVPYDLSARQGKGWKEVRSRAAYAGDYVVTTRQGAVLTLGRVKGVHELRLIAPTGPRLGKVAVRVGKGAWTKVDLGSAKARKLVVFELRGADAGALSGAVQVTALRVPAGGAVAVDAIVAR